MFDDQFILFRRISLSTFMYPGLFACSPKVQIQEYAKYSETNQMRKVQLNILITLPACIAVMGYFFILGLPTLNWPNNRDPASESLLNSIINMVTEVPIGSRFNDYIEALGVKKTGAGNRGSNPGLIAFNDGLIKGNKCFADLAAQFYSELQILDLIQTQKNSTSISSIESLLKSKRATLMDSLDKNSSPRAGFLWELAIKYADGDSNLAMQLIGLCAVKIYLPGTKKRSHPTWMTSIDFSFFNLKWF